MMMMMLMMMENQALTWMVSVLDDECYDGDDACMNT